MPQLAFTTSFGSCRVSWEEGVLTGFRLPDSQTQDDATGGDAATDPPAWIRDLRSAVRRHLEGTLEDFSAQPFAFDRVTPFQAAVYQATLTIKAGDTSTYGRLAEKLGLPPGGSRAVGAALGHNPWPLLVPCHRLVGADGSMTGFSAPGGTATKLRLLALEGAQWFSV